MSKLVAVVVLSLCTGTAAYAENWVAARHVGAVGIHRLAATSDMTAPEIDPAGAMAGLTLLAGGLAVLRGRRKK
jgi:LPXTG-motif cell wall-anchored protein